MPSALETLVKILKLERDQGYKNTAVIGGLGAFGERWKDNAHQQARIEMHHLMVDDIAQLLQSYDAVENNTERHEMVTYMLDRMLMRVTEPRADFVPTYDWETEGPPEETSVKESRPSEPSGLEREREREREVQAGRSKKTEPKQPTPAPARISAAADPLDKGDTDGHTPLEAEFDTPFNGHQELDLPPEPRLERPPRKPRRKLDAAEAADILRGLRADVTTIKGVGQKLAETWPV